LTLAGAWQYYDFIAVVKVRREKALAFSGCNSMENGFIESFNGKFRDECLNENWFLDLADDCPTRAQAQPLSVLALDPPEAVSPLNWGRLHSFSGAIPAVP
jgi:Integrase core domain